MWAVHNSLQPFRYAHPPMVYITITFCVHEMRLEGLYEGNINTIGWFAVTPGELISFSELSGFEKNSWFNSTY